MLWFQAIDQQDMKIENIRFSVLNKDSGRLCRDALLILLSEYRLTVWMCRNKMRFGKKKLSKTDMTYSFYNKIKARVGLDF